MRRYGKIAVDFAMTVLLLLLMAYERIGAAAHEWLGMAMFLLVVLHHVLNRKWSKNILSGRHSPLRIMQTSIVVLLLLSMLGSMASGVVLSQHALAFLPIKGGLSWARTVHMLCAYWGFVLMGLHLGLHWGMIMALAGKRLPVTGTWICRIAGALAALYGGYAFAKHSLADYMLLKSHFVFFDYSQPLALFLLDQLAILALFVWVGYYLSRIMRQIKKG